MSSRRTHTKSRNGCKECKRRKVKCDESYPCCFNCARHGVVCSLGGKTIGDGIVPTTVPFGGFLPAFDYSDPGVSPSAAFSNLTHLLDNSRVPETSPSTAKSEHDGYALELMHHWCMYTAATIGYRDEITQVWKTHVPELGYRCQYVMHGLLAIAALHKAVLLPSQSDTYLDLAAYYQTLGLQQFLTELHRINDDNWQQAFCFSSTVVMYALCRPELREKEASSALQKTADMLTYSRGLRAIVIPSQRRLGTTKLRPLATGIMAVDENDPSFKHPRLENSPLPRDIFDALEKLRTFYDRMPMPRRESYQAAVDDLTKAAYLVAHGGMQPEMGMVMFWAFVAPDNIVTEIQSGDPYGLLLLGYLAVLYAVLESRFWCLRNWPKLMFRAIDENLIDADGSFTEVLVWPRRQVFETYATG